VKKNLARIIAVAMTATMLAACGGTTTPAEEGGNNVENGGEEVDHGDVPLDPFGRPVYDEQGRLATYGFTETPNDFGGRNIHILTTPANYPLFNYWETVDATPNETITIMRTMQQIADDYNVTFSFERTPVPAGDLSGMLLQFRAAGDAPVDLVNMGITHTNLTPFITNQLFLPLSHASVADAIGLDTQPWPEAGKLSTFGTHQYGVHFIMANSGDLLRSVFTFNLDFMEDFSLGNFYEMVFNRQWTWDAFERICTNLVQASNGEVTPIVMRRESEIMPNFMKSNGGYIVRLGETGFEFVAPENDAFLEALQFIADLSRADMIVVDETLAWQRAGAGEFMFIPGLYEPLRQFTRGEIDTNFRWGMLPTPIGPRMDDYVSAAHAADMWFIINGVARPNEVATVLVAMANRLSKINIIETELHYGLQDEYSARIFEMLLDRIVIDYSRAVGGVRSPLTSGINGVLDGFLTPVQAMTNARPTIQHELDGARFLGH